MKFRLADIYQFSKAFPGGLWAMTAAQRALLTGGKKKAARRLSLEEMIGMTQRNLDTETPPSE